MRPSQAALRALAWVVAGAMLTTIAFFAFPGFGEFIQSIVEGLKGDPLPGRVAVVAVWDSFLVVGVFVQGIVTAIRQIHEHWTSHHSGRFKNFLEFVGVSLVAAAVFILSSSLVLDGKLPWA